MNQANRRDLKSHHNNLKEFLLYKFIEFPLEDKTELTQLKNIENYNGYLVTQDIQDVYEYLDFESAKEKTIALVKCGILYKQLGVYPSGYRFNFSNEVVL